ncbi:hypothetical protein ACN0IV_20415 [Trabulsiella odontotermitis]|uniref:hypothetical protein n=1 Tax=Trabulsiella odontotermitis TaxID=379893 RepID=UPI003AD3A1E0
MKFIYWVLLSLLFLTTSCYSRDKSEPEVVAFCAVIHKDDLMVNFPNANVKENDAYILMTQYKFEPDVAADGSRATIGGHAYIQGSGLITLQSITVLTMNDKRLTDVVVFFSKDNKILDGIYYNKVTNDDVSPFSSLAYIDSVGNVIHLNVSIYGDKGCLSKFPKALIDKLIIDK